MTTGEEGMDSGHSFRERLTGSLLQALLIVLAGAVLGSAFNALRHDRLPWVGVPSPPRAGAAISPMDVMEAWKEFQKGLVQFVDARTPSEFKAGHLPGALNMPVDEIEGKQGRVNLPSDKTLVIYCSDPECPRSAQLAELLSRQGIKGIRIMPGGWAGWYDAGLPAEGEGVQ
jgi:rhodanese-related sulfurtransferase